MSRKEKAQVTWQTVIVLAVIFISIIAVQVGLYSSETTSRIETIDSNSSEAMPQIQAMVSGLKEEAPRIQASFISGNGESFIYVGGKLVNEGDIINGFRFLKAYPDKVEFEKNGKTVVGSIYDTQAYIRSQISTRSNFKKSSQQPVSFEKSRNNKYYKQYRQPTYRKPSVAENGSYYGQISENTGRPKTVHVRGYYRKDGTYVRSHYRSPPRK